MRRNLTFYLDTRKIAEPAIPWRWKVYLAISTASFLSLAAAIALWVPVYEPIAWSLLIFSSCHLSLLVVQRVGCDPPPVDSD